MLINNAAVMANELTRVGPGGWESPFAIDPEQAERLWRVSAQLNGVDVAARV